jgi:hypothetical protein
MISFSLKAVKQPFPPMQQPMLKKEPTPFRELLSPKSYANLAPLGLAALSPINSGVPATLASLTAIVSTSSDESTVLPTEQSNLSLVSTEDVLTPTEQEFAPLLSFEFRVNHFNYQG